LLLTSHYRDSLNFTFDGLAAAETALQRLDEVWTKINEAAAQKKNGELTAVVETAEKEFEAALDDDLNISGALAVLFDFVRKINVALTSGVSKKELFAAKSVFQKIDSVLGFGFQKIKEEKIPEEIKKLLQDREQARSAKDWKRSDEIRVEIEKNGYAVEDTAKGQKVKRKI